MTPEKTAKLFRDFPQLYADHTKPATESCMAYGFSCDDGWFDLVHRLSARIERTLRDARGRRAPIVATQVKQEFGELRFYVHARGKVTTKAQAAVFAAIEAATEESRHTCEVCGEPGRVRLFSERTLRATCDEHGAGAENPAKTRDSGKAQRRIPRALVEASRRRPRRGKTEE